MVCPKCGAEVVAEAMFCHKCGQRLSGKDSQAGPGAKEASSAPAQTPMEKFKAAAAEKNSAEEQENELWRGGYSSKAMIGAWCLCALVTIVLLIIGFWAWRSWLWIVILLAIIGFWGYNLILLFYRRLSVRYLLTNQRFVHESGILRRVIDRIEVIDMDDISFEQGIIDRMVGVGKIRIMSSDRTHPELVLQGIDNVREISGLFDDTRRSERRRRGLHIESI
jgi:membrane protein YdbS with pleckstrin-like domain